MSCLDLLSSLNTQVLIIRDVEIMFTPTSKIQAVIGSKITFLLVTLALVLSSCLQVGYCQESVLGTISKIAEDIALPKTRTPPAVILKIPTSAVVQSVNQDYNHRVPVDRVLLGTHSRGIAVCNGKVECSLIESQDDARFLCTIKGQIRSDTRGTNGPAIINAHSLTSYTAHKKIYFNGEQFVSEPTSVQANTQVQIKGIDSSLPRLRGRIVKRIAAQRAAESRPQAEAISTQLAIEDLKRHIDKDFDQRLVDMNQKVANANLLVKGFLASGGQLKVRSDAEGIEIHLLPKNERPQYIKANQKSHNSDSVELWVQIGKQDNERISLANLVTQVPSWLSSILSQEVSLLKVKDNSLEFGYFRDWVILRFRT